MTEMDFNRITFFKLLNLQAVDPENDSFAVIIIDLSLFY